jgi:ferredoxin
MLGVETRSTPRDKLTVPAAPGRRRRIMKILVDRDLCEANAICMGIASDIFEVDDEDVLHVLDESPPESRRAAVERAVAKCPRAALSIEG